MKYEQIPQIVEVDKYEKGMEDGVVCLHYKGKICMEVGRPLLPESDYPMCTKCKTNQKFCHKPFIRTANGHVLINDDTMIITKEDGTRHAVDSDFLNKNFRKIEDK